MCAVIKINYCFNSSEVFRIPAASSRHIFQDHSVHLSLLNQLTKKTFTIISMKFSKPLTGFRTMWYLILGSIFFQLILDYFAYLYHEVLEILVLFRFFKFLSENIWVNFKINCDHKFTSCKPVASKIHNLWKTFTEHKIKWVQHLCDYRMPLIFLKIYCNVYNHRCSR